MTLIVMVVTVSNMAILSALLWGCSNQYKSVSDLMINEILTHELQLDSLKICPHQGLSRTMVQDPRLAPDIPQTASKMSQSQACMPNDTNLL